MPNINLTVYLSDEDFVKYIKSKVEINTKSREYVKKLIEKQA